MGWEVGIRLCYLPLPVTSPSLLPHPPCYLTLTVTSPSMSPHPHPYPGLTSTRGVERCSCFACTTLLGPTKMISTYLSSGVHPLWPLGPSPLMRSLLLPLIRMAGHCSPGVYFSQPSSLIQPEYLTRQKIISNNIVIPYGIAPGSGEDEDRG